MEEALKGSKVLLGHVDGLIGTVATCLIKK